MATAATRPGYDQLEPHPDSFYTELFVRGLNLLASRLVAWMEAEGLTPEEAAADRQLPVEVVLQAMHYVSTHSDLIASEMQREHRLLRDRGLLNAVGP